MTRRAIAALLQREPEEDREFAAHVDALSRSGLRTIALAFPSVVVFMGAALHVLRYEGITRPSLALAAGILILSAGCFALSRTRVPFPRATAWVALAAAGSLFTWMALVRTHFDPAADRYVAGQMAMTMMIALVSLPLRPLQVLGLGVTLTGVYFVSTAAGPWSPNAMVMAALIMLTLMATALGVVLYERAWEQHRAWSAQLETSRELSRDEIRRFVAQSAATTSRMAAALSHEVNTPVGALKSSIDTLSALAARREGATEVQLVRIAALEEQVRRSARDAANRLSQVVQRIQRVTNLDRAEVQMVDMNALLKDVVYLLDSETRVREREVDLKLSDDLPPVKCKPQHISAVLSNLFAMAIEQQRRQLTVETRPEPGEVHIVFHGLGSQHMSAAETQAVFDPGFAERSGRVMAGNWGLFMARQVIREHGGDMRMERNGDSSMLVLSLPARAQTRESSAS